MNKMMRFLLALTLTAPMYTLTTQAEVFADLNMNGLATFTHLRKDYYIGALMLPRPSDDPAVITAMDGSKSMDIRVVIDDWSSRRFAKQWNEAIYLNNELEEQEQFADEIQRFVDLAKEELVTGDQILVNLNENKTTSVYLNGNKVIDEADGGLFYLLLNTWIGNKPPSTDFKQNILVMSTDQESTSRLVAFDGTNFSEQRAKAVSQWFAKEKTESDNQPPAFANLPPEAGATTVKAKSSVAVAVPTTATVSQASKVNIEEPTIELEKPNIQLTQTTAAKKSKPEAPAQHTKPADTKAAKPQAPSAEEVAAEKAKTAAEQQQAQEDSLLAVYRSNVLKLAYQNTIYPKRSISLGQEGVVIYTVSINRSGKVTDIEEKQTSEHSLLNRAAKKAIRQASPFPEPPSELTGDSFEFEFPFNFKL